MENNNKVVLIGGIVAIVLVVGGLFLAMDNNDESVNDTAIESSQTATSNTPADDAEVASTTSTIVELAQDTDDLSTLVAAVVQADLVETLNSDGPFTVFAPTNEAFNALLAKLDVSADELLARDDLADILTYHVVSGKVMAADLSDGQVIKTVQGSELTVSVSDAGVTLTDIGGNKAAVTAADIDASNGVVHLIDAVVLPL